MILLIDNYDSFTFNLLHYLKPTKREIKVVRNDKITIEEIEKLKPEAIIISPGPKAPKDAGICLDLIKKFYTTIPILGICLGHQSIGEAFNGSVIKGKKLVHGKITGINHNGEGLFKDIPKDTLVARYHSLVVDSKNFPKELVITATDEDGEIMALKHSKYPVFGLQFHPESYFSTHGQLIIDNFFKEVAL